MSGKLTNRLLAAVSLVRGGGILADIGTDHAYLPVFLLEEGRISHAIASDVRPGPLANAAQTAEKSGLAEKITLRLSDGLDAYAPGEADEFVFAGMGGTLIAQLLEKTDWIADSRYHFVFQPQSRAEDLRAFLFQNGFTIHREIAVREGERYYIALDASYTGETLPCTPADCYLGKLLPSPEAKAYLLRQYRRLEKKHAALYSSEPDSARVRELCEILEKIKDFLHA